MNREILPWNGNLIARSRPFLGSLYSGRGHVHVACPKLRKKLLHEPFMTPCPGLTSDCIVFQQNINASPEYMTIDPLAVVTSRRCVAIVEISTSSPISRTATTTSAVQRRQHCPAICQPLFRHISTHLIFETNTHLSVEESHYSSQHEVRLPHHLPRPPHRPHLRCRGSTEACPRYLPV